MNPRHINSYEIESNLEVVAYGSERGVRWRERKCREGNERAEVIGGMNEG